MRLFHYTLSIILFISCNSSDYSEEEEAKLEEAQKIHNEAMATYAEAKTLLAELTEVRSELRRQLGLEAGGSNAIQPSASQDTASQTTDTGNTNKNRNTAEPDNTGNDKSAAPDNPSPGSNTPSTGSTSAAGDTATVDSKTRKILDQLNQAQNDLLLWMRDIYTVPGLSEGSDGEKTKDPAVGMDFDSRRLTKDIKLKEFPENTSVDEMYETQKEMKESIDQILNDMRNAIAEGKKASI